LGEDIQKTAVREVFEETGIETSSVEGIILINFKISIYKQIRLA
jgi:8-oxo-dGTP pyrophosphatase MutT (NUDIX family)